MDGSAHNDTNQQPEKSRQVSELCGKHRPDERSRAGNGREMVSEQNPFVRRIVILTVIELMSRCGAVIIQGKDFCGDERAVVPVRDGQDPERWKDEV